MCAAQVAARSAPGQWLGPPLGYENMQPDLVTGVFNRDALGPFFCSAALRRVDIVCIGDSNQLLLGHGWDEAYTQAASERWPLYATGLLSAGENFGNGAGMGWTFGGSFPAPGNGFIFGGAPSPWNTYLNAAAVLQPQGYLYLPDGVVGNASVNMGISIQPDSPLDPAGPMRFWITHATFDRPEPAVFTPVVRLNVPPYTALAGAQPINAATGVDGVWTSSLSLEAGERGGPLSFRPFDPASTPTGPFVQYYSRAENSSRARGISIHTLYGLGGQSARDMGEALAAASDPQLSLYFSLVRSLQTGDKSVLVRISTGVNDRSETSPSLGATPITPGNIPSAFVANLRAVMDRIRGIWSLNGWDAGELYFLISVSPPIQRPPDDSLLQAYRDAADDLALQTPRCAVTHFERLTSVTEAIRNGWLLYDVDTFHLRPPGHLELARRELDAARSSAAWVDLNGDGGLDAEDLYHEITLQVGESGGSMPVAAAGATAPAPGANSSPALTRAVRWDERAHVMGER